MSNKQIDLNSLTFCVFDLETTGGNHEKDQIIEIGLVKIENLKIVAEKDFLINPERDIPDFIQRLTKIRQSDVSHSPVINDVIDEIIQFMGDSILVAHNVSFDVPFFNSVLRRLNKPEMKNKTMCTNLMTKYLIPNILNSNLNYMSKLFSIGHLKAHRALEDANATANLLLKYLAIFKKKKIQKLNHLYYPQNKYELDRLNIKRGEEKELFATIQTIKTPFAIIYKGKEGAILDYFAGENKAESITFITEQIQNTEWELITIRLFGHILESVANVVPLFEKLPNLSKEKLINFWWKELIPYKKEVGNTITPKETEIPVEFVIIPHLIPEQLVAIPLFLPVHTNSTVFRTPSHNKKTLQFMYARFKKVESDKSKKNFGPKDLSNLIGHYVLNLKEQNGKDVIFITKDEVKKQDILFKKIEDFSASVHVNSQYPKNHL